MRDLPLPPVSFQFNNRKLIQGFYRGLGIADVTGAIRIIDKLDKLPGETVAEQLVEQAGASPEQAEQCLALAGIRVEDTSFVEQVRALGVQDELLETGLPELAAVIEGCLPAASDGVAVEANLRIARGLDYYTGTVVEIFMSGYEHLKSVGGGGRYDALADDGKNVYPGVGVSFGVSRTIVPLLADGVLEASRSVPSAVLVAVSDEESRPASERVAAALRARRIPTEVAASPQKFGKQIRYAERRGIPFVWFPNSDGSHEVEGHSYRGAGVGRSGHLDPTRGRPATAGQVSRLASSHLNHRDGAIVIRTHDAGALRAEHVGQTVTLAGWVAKRRDHGGVAFLDLREASGVVQVVVRDEAVAHSLRSEFCIKVTGTVSRRPEGNANPNLPSGDIEVIAEELDVLSAAAALPFPIDEHIEVGEEARLKHRYLDLRRSAPTRRSACAARSTGRLARCCTPTTSWRWRRPR